MNSFLSDIWDRKFSFIKNKKQFQIVNKYTKKTTATYLNVNAILYRITTILLLCAVFLYLNNKHASQSHALQNMFVRLKV